MRRIGKRDFKSVAACFAWSSVSNWFLKCPSTCSVKPASGGTSARGAGLDIGLVVVAAGVGGTAMGAGIGVVIVWAGFRGKVRASRGTVAIGFSAAPGAALLLPFTTSGLATLPFADASFAGVLVGVFFADALVLAVERGISAGLRGGALVLAVFIRHLD